MLVACLALAPLVLGQSPVRQKTAGWVYIADGPQERWGEVPQSWSDIAFDELDILLVGPLGLQQCDWTPRQETSFPWHPIYRCQKGSWDDGNWGVNASLKNRFEKLLQMARQQNGNMEILVAQWWSNDLMQPLVSWGGNLGALGNSSAQLYGYASAVKAFIDKYKLNGYVLDYEATNVVSWYPALLQALSAAFRAGSGPAPKIAISPATGTYLMGTNNLTDYVFLQSYASKVQTSDFLATFDAQKLFYGLCPEGCSKFTAQAAAFEVKNFALGGIHAWRLNSDNVTLMEHESNVMRQARQSLHGTAAKSSAITQEQLEVAQASKAAAAAFSKKPLPKAASPAAKLEETQWGPWGDPRQGGRGPPMADLQGPKNAAQWEGMQGSQPKQESGFFNLIDTIHKANKRRLVYT